MSNRQVDAINKRKSESEAKVIAYNEVIEDHKKFQDLCESAIKCKVDPKIIRKVNYNAIIAKNAAENSDVAGPNDRIDAEQSIKDCIINLSESKNNLEAILNDSKGLTCEDLVMSKNELQAFIKSNISSCEIALKYSQSVLNGEFNRQLEKEFNMEIENQEKSLDSNNSFDFGEQVVSEEPYEDVEENDMFKDLDKALDEAISPVEDDIKDLNVNLEDISSVETDDVNLDNNIEPSSLFEESAPLEETEEAPLTIENSEEIVSAASVDEGPVRVDEVIEVGAPEEEIEEENIKSRRLAA